MSYQVIARKFRPQSFSEFVGQTHVTQTLINALKSDRFPHAILLTGPRGTGKTTTARIIAKTLLCKNLQDDNPCGECQSCVDLTSGSHLDVIEIDGASNNGVDHIRELRETVGYMPSSGSHKVYIIDEVHMLSNSAFNALLKTLEEPPEHVIFIFATTEVQKIPATILSRCQRFDFRNHALTDIRDNLQKICEAEKIEFEDAALLMIARQANGSIRDSLTLMDQLISFSGGKLTLDAVMKVLGLTDRNLLLSCLKAVATADTDLMFKSLNDFKNSGYDPKLFTEEFLELVRNSLMILKECHKNFDLNIPEAEVAELENICKNLSEEMVHLLFDVTLSGAQRLNYSNDASLALEMLMFKLLNLPRLTQSLPAPGPGASAPQPVSVKATTPAPQAKVAPAKAEPKKEAKTSIAVPLPSDDHPVGKTWEEFVLAVKQANGFLGALLEHTSVFEEDDKILRLGLPNKMSFLFDKLKEEKNIDRTENFLRSFWSDHRKVEVVLLDKSQSQQTLSPKAKEEQNKQNQARQEADTVQAHPLVQAAEKVFQENITKVDVRDSSPQQQERPQ